MRIKLSPNGLHTIYRKKRSYVLATAGGTKALVKKDKHGLRYRLRRTTPVQAMLVTTMKVFVGTYIVYRFNRFASGLAFPDSVII